jgi:hypothetical protein
MTNRHPCPTESSNSAQKLVGGNSAQLDSLEPLEIRYAIVGHSPRSSSVPLDAFRKYATLPVRMLLFVFALAISLLLIATGTPWRNEWDRMNISGHLFEGKNWNSAGF